MELVPGLLGAVVIRKTDWRKGKTEPFGKVVRVLRLPSGEIQARVQWLWSRSETKEIFTRVSSIKVTSLQLVEPTAVQPEQTTQAS